jgi:hypothetical protein
VSTRGLVRTDKHGMRLGSYGITESKSLTDRSGTM